jgi:hypothetical protein
MGFIWIQNPVNRFLKELTCDCSDETSFAVYLNDGVVYAYCTICGSRYLLNDKDQGRPLI